MNNELMAKGMLLGMSSLGIVVDRLEENVLYISVPKDTTDSRHALAGKALAKRLQTKMRELGYKDLVVKYKIRNEVWTKEKSDFILKRKVFSP